MSLEEPQVPGPGPVPVPVEAATLGPLPSGWAEHIVRLLRHLFKRLYLVMVGSDCHDQQSTMVLQTGLVMNMFTSLVSCPRMLMNSCLERPPRRTPHRIQPHTGPFTSMWPYKHLHGTGPGGGRQFVFFVTFRCFSNAVFSLCGGVLVPRMTRTASCPSWSLFESLISRDVVWSDCHDQQRTMVLQTRPRHDDVLIRSCHALG